MPSVARLPKATPTPTTSSRVFGRIMAAAFSVYYLPASQIFWKDDGRRILSVLFTRVPNFDLEAVKFAKFDIVNVKKEGAASLNFGAVETVFI
jgi:hypothetical protein